VFRAGFARCPLDGAALQGLTGDPLIGHLLADRYVIEELLGEGGMGRVYGARHMRMSRRFAVKVLFGDMAADAKARTRFSREAEAVSRLNHPNVLSVIDFGETEEGLLYLVMDLIEGRELHQLLAQEAPLATLRALALLRQLARGLAHAHERNLVHRDFKTENVVVTRSGDEELARIVDFGIAAVGEMMEPNQRLTTEGMVLGTPAYMSPEQSTGEEVDERSDLFSLGVMLYEMLCGRLPFDGTAVAIAKAHLASDVPPIAVRVPGLRADPRLEAVSMRLMAKDPAGRYQSARALLAHLDSAFGQADGHPDEEDLDATIQVTSSEQERALSIAELVISPLESSDQVSSGRTRRVHDTRWLISGGAVLLTLIAVVVALVLRGGDEARGKRAAAVPEPIPSASRDPGQAPAAGASSHAVSAATSEPTASPDPVRPPEPAPAAEARPIPLPPADREKPAEVAAPAAPPRPRERARPRARPARAKAERTVKQTRVPETPESTSPAAPEVKETPVPPLPAVAADPVVSTREFLARYERVGNQLELLSSRKGEAAVASLRRRWMDIPLQDALRSEAVRRDADRSLRTIAIRVARALADVR
jgi:serine/threonine-protein kinase